MPNPASQSNRPPPNRPLAASLEPAILAFEQAWQAASPPCVSDFVSDCDSRSKSRLASELALIDMEFRWRASAEGQVIDDRLGGQPRWQDYALHIREIGEAQQIPPELVAEEYRIRQLWGDRPSHDHFISAFATQLALLPKWLTRVDDELRADGAMEPYEPSPSVSAAPDPRAPLPWSDYLLQKHIGSGGFGKVYRAVQKSLGRTVAVKALHKARQRDPQAIEQFIQEARLLARLRHPGIVGVHGLGRFPGGGYFLVMDWIDGEDLQQRLNQGPISIEEAVRITSAVAGAIQHAHEHGVIHGDLKPSNVLVGSEDEVYVTDFGLAVMLPTTGSSGNEPINLQGGTIAYLAPEVVRGGRASVAVDVYGLGVLLYALLTGQPPRQGNSAESILAELEAGYAPVPPSAVRADVPAQLDAIVMKCMESSAEARYGAAEEVAAALSK